MPSLPGHAGQPFRQRFNLHCAAHYTNLATIIGLASLVLFWLRFPTPGLLNKMFMTIQAAVFTGELLWRRHYLAHPGSRLGASYLSHREALVAVLRLNEALLGPRCLWIKAWLDTAGPGSVDHSGWRPMLRHMGVLVNGSSVVVRLMLWAAPMRISFALPLHILMVLTLVPGYRVACTSPALSDPTPQALTHRAFSTIQMLRYSLVMPGVVELPNAEECSILLTYTHIMLGLLLPAMLAAATEARLFALHQQQRREQGLPPERGMHAAVCDMVHHFVLGFDVLTWFVVLWLLAGLLLDVAILLSSKKTSLSSMLTYH